MVTGGLASGWRGPVAVPLPAAGGGLLEKLLASVRPEFRADVLVFDRCLIPFSAAPVPGPKGEGGTDGAGCAGVTTAVARGGTAGPGPFAAAARPCPGTGTRAAIVPGRRAAGSGPSATACVPRHDGVAAGGGPEPGGGPAGLRRPAAGPAGRRA